MGGEREQDYFGREKVQRHNPALPRQVRIWFHPPESLAKLPQKVKNKLNDQVVEAEAAGKEVTNPDLLYFRKPDVNHAEGFKLSEDVAVTFKVYIDDKGAGACDVSPA